MVEAIDRPIRFEGQGGALLVSIRNLGGRYVTCHCYLVNEEQLSIGGHILDQVVQAVHEWLSPPEWLRRGAHIRYCSGNILNLADPHHSLYASVDSGRPVLRIQDAMSVEWIGKIILTEEQVEKWLQQVEELRQWHIALKGRDPLAR